MGTYQHIDDVEDDDSYYLTNQPTSAIRYVMPNANVAYHSGYAPVKPRRTAQQYALPAPQPVAKRRHWLTYVGVFLMTCLVGYCALTIIGTWWQSKLDDWTYGNPRTFQTDAVVGHSDSISNPTHFIAVNLRGTVIIAEYPGGNASKARSYTITTGSDPLAPVRLSFSDVNQDGRLDMKILIGDGNPLQVVLLNNGSQFVSKL